MRLRLISLIFALLLAALFLAGCDDKVRVTIKVKTADASVKTSTTTGVPR